MAEQSLQPDPESEIRGQLEDWIPMTRFEIEKKDNIATLTINQPESLNALSTSPDWAEYDSYMRSVFFSLKNDPDVRVIIVTGAGDKAFSSGANVKNWGRREALYRKIGRPRPPVLMREGTQMPYIWMRHLQKPSIAAVNGLAVGMGADLALACDFRIASEKAWFQWAYILRGMMPMDGACWLLPRLAGPAKAMELLMTGDRVYAEEAQKLGIVNKVVPHEKLKEATWELATKIAKGPWAAIQMVRYSVYAGMTQSFTDNLGLAMLAENMEHETIAEGMIARGVEKKDADFKGK